MAINFFNDVEDKAIEQDTALQNGSSLSDVAAISAGAGDEVFKADQSGIWLGASKFQNAPFRVNMQGQAWFAIGSNTTFEEGYDPTQIVAVNIFKQASIPTSENIGDIWFDTDDSNKIYRADSVGANEIKSGEWELVQDAGVITALEDAAQAIQDAATAQSAAEAAQASADGKITTFYQSTIPTSEGIGDLWLDTDDSNKLYRAAMAGADAITAGEWEAVRDAGIGAALTAASDAQSTADGKIVTFYQSNIPTSEGIGDIWFDTDDSNKVYRAASVGANEIKAGEWVAAQDLGIGTALTNAGTAQTTADAKVKVFKQTSIPTSVSAGDLWIDTDDNNKLYRATAVGDTTIASGHWEEVTDGRTVDAILKAGTSQVLSGDMSIGNANVKIDGANTRIIINDGTDDRILIGYQLGGF